MDYFNAANECYKTKDYKKAISLYQKAIDNKDNEASAYYNSAVCFIKLCQYDTAIDLINKALKIKKESKYYFNLAYCYAMKKNNKKALQYFNTSWAMDNEDKECEKAIKLILKNICKHP
ncbi:MAG: tetratricopeptide repeat protein [Clostridiaceae bacterium]